ncbi:MAG TPA: aminotransferase class V-fold PLP-dependent enzyme [Armatimonadetes bacterium]|nr:aminotransferase class V-fold PLP-dependent enzyme [Armatimonadota bacterium]
MTPNCPTLDIEAYRPLFPVTQHHIFLNHAAVAPVSTRVVEAVNEYFTDVLRAGGTNEPAWLERVKKARADAAALVGAEPEEIAFVKNTTEGLLFVANGIRWREGDNAVTASCEFPANVYPWRNLARWGVETRFVKPRGGRILVDDVRAALDRRTRVVSLSFVQYFNGFRADLEALGTLCRERGVLFCVDAIQGLGALQLDVSRTPVDFFSADGHKWLLAPEGIGVFYCRRERLEDLEPLEAGWWSVQKATYYAPDYSTYTAPLRNDAQRFEPGTRNNAGLFGLGAALALLREIGILRIEARILALTDRLIEGLQRRGYTILSPLRPAERSGIVTFRRKGQPALQLHRRLREANILVSLRHNAVRVSPHFYNTEEEIDALLEALPA